MLILLCLCFILFGYSQPILQFTEKQVNTCEVELSENIKCKNFGVFTEEGTWLAIYQSDFVNSSFWFFFLKGLSENVDYRLGLEYTSPFTYTFNNVDTYAYRSSNGIVDYNNELAHFTSIVVEKYAVTMNSNGDYVLSYKLHFKVSSADKLLIDVALAPITDNFQHRFSEGNYSYNVYGFAVTSAITGSYAIFEDDNGSNTPLIDNFYNTWFNYMNSDENRYFNNGYTTGYYVGFDNGEQSGYIKGYDVGFDDAQEISPVVTSIFNGIFSVGLLPINVFLTILNFEVFGINIAGLVSGLLTISVLVILFRFIFGVKND